MAKNTYSIPSSFFLTNLKLEDMRPRENFTPGDVVDCIDRPRLHDGKLIRIDCDQRLGLVEWPDGDTGWWYLKDLTIKKSLSSMKLENKKQKDWYPAEFLNNIFLTKALELEIASAESASQ